MSTQSSSNAPLIEELDLYLKAGRYSTQIRQRYLPLAQRFIDYLERRAAPMGTASAWDVAKFLRRELRAFSKRHGRPPRHRGNWRKQYMAAIHIVLRLLQAEGAIAAEPATALEAFHRKIIQGYDSWMRELRGLASVTRLKRTEYALQFLTSLGPRGDRETIAQLGIGDIDVYLRQRCSGLRRSSIEDHTGSVRSFLRFLHNSGRTASDLSGIVLGPRIYDYEHIPSALRAEDVEKVLAITREDRSPMGRRDYAVLMLLAVYGLRAGEIAQLRLEDIDWQEEVIHVRHSKTGTHSELPLLRAPGEAVLRYLKEARPTSVRREVFLLVRAPYGPFKSSSSIGGVAHARLRKAGVTHLGRKGAHAFRHARAVSLLRAGSSLKTIGDVLGHRATNSTMAYLKLATNDLRAVGLDLPSGVSP
jgi:site-specific recombinase XerD